jgi:Uma2 family endonuclease
MVLIQEVPMIAIAPKIEPPLHPESLVAVPSSSEDCPEQRITYDDRTWEQFKLIEQGLAGLSGLRLFYFDGKVEILMPSKSHELFKKSIAVLVEAFLFEREIEFEATGSMTQRLEGFASAEADESYRIGEFGLVVEVIFTSGRLDKLGLYRAIGINEVWFWEDGVLSLFHLGEDGYERVDRSLIPGLDAIDVAVLSRCVLVGETSFIQARKEFLAGHPRPPV